MCLLAAEGRIKQAEAMLSMWAENPRDDFELQLICTLITLLEGVPETIREADNSIERITAPHQCNDSGLTSHNENCKSFQNHSSGKLNEINDAVFDCLLELKKILKVSELYINSSTPEDNGKSELILIDLFSNIAHDVHAKLEKLDTLSS